MQPASTKISSKHQFTIPKSVWSATGLRVGDPVNVLPHGHGFVVQPKRRELLITKYRGWLKPLDDGRPTEEIIEEAKRRAAHEIATGKPWTPQADHHAHRRTRHQRSA